jgi:MFS family permease
MSTAHNPFSALQYRDFRLLMGGRFIAQIGEMMVSIAIGWELYERTNDALALGLVGLVQVIPVILLSLPGGYAADRYDRKRVTLISQLFLMAMSVVLLVLSATQGSLTLIYIVLALIGVGRAFNNPAEGAITPETIPPQAYENAAAWSSAVWQISAILGPAVGGLLIGLTNSAAVVYGVNVAAGAVLVVAILLMRSKQTDFAAADEPPLQALYNGWKFVRNSQFVLGSITLDMFAVLLGGAIYLLPVYARDILHVDATGLGLLRAAPSVGALITALLLARSSGFQRAGAALLWSVAGFGLATIIFGISTNFWLSLAMLALTGALDMVSVVIRHTLVMLKTPAAMRARVNAVNTTFIGVSNEMGGFRAGVAASFFGGIPALALGGLSASAVGPTWAVVSGGVGTILVVLLVARFAPELRRLGRMKAD